LNAEEEVRFNEFLNHLKEFLVSRILFRICYHCEYIRSHRNLLSGEYVKGQTQLNVHASRHNMSRVMLVMSQVKHAEVYSLHHAPKTIVIIHAIRLEQWNVRTSYIRA
jgi:hypothetical protein